MILEGTAPPCVPNAALARLFTPPHPQKGQYAVCAVAESIDDLVSTGQTDGMHYGAIEALEALEAFGGAGPYDRGALATLFGGTRVRVARGWVDGPHAHESVTLLSPYPDPTLTRLVPGTMAIRWKIVR